MLHVVYNILLSRLKISDTSVVDNGLYSCEGRNEFGQQNTSGNLIIKSGQFTSKTPSSRYYAHRLYVLVVSCWPGIRKYLTCISMYTYWLGIVKYCEVVDQCEVYCEVYSLFESIEQVLRGIDQCGVWGVRCEVLSFFFNFRLLASVNFT